MFGTILIAGFTALLAYVLWRAASVPLLAHRLSRKVLVGIGAALVALFFAARLYGHDGTGSVAIALEFAGMTLLGSVFLIFAVLLAVDLVTLFGFALSRWAPWLRGAALAAGAVLSGIALVQGHRAPAVVSYEVVLPSLPPDLDGTILAAVSDTHVGNHLGQRWLAERAGQIRALEPDMVVFLGDIFEGHGEAPSDIPALRNLEAPLGKWFVHGNHESHHRNDGQPDDVLERAGFRRLDDQWVEIAPGLVLAGVNDLTSHARRDQAGDPLGRALANRPAGATVLLSHTPWQAERAARAGAELMLSGHTHGGQIWPFGYLVQTVYPLLAGRYEIDGMTAIVCRGTGTWGPRMRLWHRSEILKITLRAPGRRAGRHRLGSDPSF